MDKARAARMAAADKGDRAKQTKSRICIKNLPVHVDETRLRSIFAAQCADGAAGVTDVKLLRTADGRSRKMAFVGLRTTEAAARAIKHFNKSFIDTSRVDVEYALNPREAQEALRPWSKYSEGSSRHDAHTAAKTAATDARSGNASAPTADASKAPKDAVAARQAAVKASGAFSKSALFGLASDSSLASLLTDPKFSEYLHVMGSRSKNKFWSNNAAEIETGKAGGKANMMTTAEEMAAVRGEQGFQTYEQYLAEQRAADRKQGRAADSDSDDDDAFDQPMLDRDVDEQAPRSSAAAAASKKPASATAAAGSVAASASAVDPVALDSSVSDLDYLRSKQAGGKDFDDDSDMEDEPQPAAAAAAPATEDGTGKASKKRKAVETTAPAENAEEEGDAEDAGLRAEYEQEQRAAETAAGVADAAQRDHQELLDSGRLFLRNLSYTVTEADLTALLSPFGQLSEVHVPVDATSKKPKGFAYAAFMFPAHAQAAQRALDGNFFLGRLLHVMLARLKPVAKSEWEQLQAMGDDALSKVTYKKKKELETKALAGSKKDAQSWNTLFVRSDTVTDSIAAKYGLAKRDILDTSTSSSSGEDGTAMAVRLALAETQLINETKKFLSEHGVRMSAFEGNKASTPRSSTAILVKNLPFNVDLDEIRRLFVKFGPLGHIVMPPSRVLVMLEFLEARDAKNAFKNLAYKKFKYVPLYLEWAPEGAFEGGAGAGAAGVVEGKNKANELLNAPAATAAAASTPASASAATPADEAAAAAGGDSCTLYVKNLSFSTTEQSLQSLFAPLGAVRSVSISRKKNTKARPGTADPQYLSQGYGFVEFKTAADAARALAKAQGMQLDNHALEVKLSSRGSSAAGTGDNKAGAASSSSGGAPAGGKIPSSKLLVKNVPFETTARELRDLFSAFGSIQRIRLPKKFGQLGHRGFAFIDFVTKSEAAHAMEQVKHSHLYGRHLVIEYAAPTQAADASGAGDVEALRAKTASNFAVQQQGAPPNKRRKGAVQDEDADDIEQAFSKKFT